MDTDARTTHDAEEDARNRDIKIYVNGDIVHRHDAKVSVYDSGFMLGDGMWEGMRLYRGVWAFFDEHMDRLFDSCRAVSLDIELTDEQRALVTAGRIRFMAHAMHEYHGRHGGWAASVEELESLASRLLCSCSPATRTRRKVGSA